MERAAVNEVFDEIDEAIIETIVVRPTHESACGIVFEKH